MPSKTTTTAATTTATYQTPLIPQPTTAAVLLIPLPLPRLRHHDLLLKLPLLLLILILLSLSIFYLYPSSPTLTLTRLRLNHISVLTKPSLSLSLSFSLTLRVLNPDVFSLWLSSLHVSISYRGHDLGFLDSQPYSTVSPRSVSYINATLDLDGAEVIGDVIYLIEDVAKGVIPFDTTTDVSGGLGILFFKVPIKGKVSCEMLVNIKNQMITDQNCSPQVCAFFAALACSDLRFRHLACGFCLEYPSSTHLVAFYVCFANVMTAFVLIVHGHLISPFVFAKISRTLRKIHIGIEFNDRD